MKKYFIIHCMLLLFVSGIYSQIKVETGRVTVNSNSAVADGSLVVCGAIFNFVYQESNYNQFMRLQVGTTNPRIAGSQDCVVFYNNQNSQFNDIQVKEVFLKSDRNAKTNVNPVFNALDQVKYLNPVTYDWKSEQKSKWRKTTHDIGFIAQDVEQVFPDIVAEDEDGNKLLNYSAIIPILTKAIKE